MPFLADVQRRLFDERGNFVLYRQIRPVGVPGLYSNGYNSSTPTATTRHSSAR